MPPKRNYGKIIVLSVIGIIVLVLLLFPIHVPYTIHAPCKIVPVKEWIVEKNSEGVITVSLYDHKSGSVEMNSYDPGSIAGYKFSPHPRNAEFINPGDTVGYIELRQTDKAERKIHM